MKAYILDKFEESTINMLNKFLNDFQAQPPEKVVLDPSVQLEPQLDQAAKAIIWQLAFGEAVWSLVGAALLIPKHENLYEIGASQEWTTVVPGGGGHSAGWHFTEYHISVPKTLRIAPSAINNLPQPLSDPDLYLTDFEIGGMHAEVEDSLRQAALCFRHELYVPCLAMLAKASEGAWIELGLTLLEFAPDNPVLSAGKRNKFRATLNSQYDSFIMKMDTVVQIYDKQDIFAEVLKASGYNQRYLKEVVNWSRVVQDSRNAVHYGADPATQNNYEKVAALLLGAVPNLRILYSIRRAAE
jgi:hypothetical protein